MRGFPIAVLITDAFHMPLAANTDAMKFGSFLQDITSEECSIGESWA
jgi:hypothetical protein